MKKTTLINPKDASLLPTGKIVEIHNILSEKPVKAFKDRATALARTNALVAKRRAEGEAEWVRVLNGELADYSEYFAVEATKEIKKAAKKEKKAAVKKVAAKPKSALAGKRLRKLEKKNPRKEGTHGHKSWDAYKSNTKYEKAVEAGARPQDIQWDISKGWVEAID